MNELDALEKAVTDQERDQHGLEQATTPEDVLGIVKFTLDVRLFELVSRRLIDKGRTTQDTLSVRIGRLVTEFLKTTKEHGDFEDERSALLWTLGLADQTPGYIHGILMALPDTQTLRVLKILGDYAEARHAEMDEWDRKLFSQPFPRSIRKILSGMFLEVQWAKADGEGEVQAQSMKKARNFAKFIVKQQKARPPGWLG